MIHLRSESAKEGSRFFRGAARRLASQHFFLPRREVDSSHVIVVSQPEAVTDVILKPRGPWAQSPNVLASQSFKTCPSGYR
jgi:hypothetical protein